MRYHQFGRSGETVYQDLDVNTEQVTLNNLIPGKVYVICISGYTSAGVGKTRTVSAACKFVTSFARFFPSRFLEAE